MRRRRKLVTIVLRTTPADCHVILPKFSPHEVMGKQPNTICIDGVEIPSAQYLWELSTKQAARVDNLKIALRLHSIALILTVVALILK